MTIIIFRHPRTAMPECPLPAARSHMYEHAAADAGRLLFFFFFPFRRAVDAFFDDAASAFATAQPGCPSPSPRMFIASAATTSCLHPVTC